MHEGAGGRNRGTCPRHTGLCAEGRRPGMRPRNARCHGAFRAPAGRGDRPLLHRRPDARRTTSPRSRPTARRSPSTTARAAAGRRTTSTSRASRRRSASGSAARPTRSTAATPSSSPAGGTCTRTLSATLPTERRILAVVNCHGGAVAPREGLVLHCDDTHLRLRAMRWTTGTPRRPPAAARSTAAR